MAPEVRQIALVPRHSAFVGARTFKTQPLAVREFGSANITVWKGNYLGTSPVLDVHVETSRDLQTWSVGQPFVATANSEETKLQSFDMEWMRISIEVSGTAPVVSCWVVGDFYPRVLQGA